MKTIWVIAGLVLGAMSLAQGPAADMNQAESTHEGNMETAQMDYRSLPLKTIRGDTVRLADFAGQVLLVVNTASKCGNTPQYEGLEELYKRYKEQGFTVIGFPANNFKGQEPGTDEEILAFCQATYDVTFPMMSKISVKGEDQHPLYTYFTKQSPLPGEITWNFNKFLLDREGRVVARWNQKTKPEDPALVATIEKTLAQPSPR